MYSLCALRGGKECEQKTTIYFNKIWTGYLKLNKGKIHTAPQIMWSTNAHPNFRTFEYAPSKCYPLIWKIVILSNDTRINIDSTDYHHHNPQNLDENLNDTRRILFIDIFNTFYLR